MSFLKPYKRIKTNGKNTQLAVASSWHGSGTGRSPLITSPIQTSQKSSVRLWMQRDHLRASQRNSNGKITCGLNETQEEVAVAEVTSKAL